MHKIKLYLKFYISVTKTKGFFLKLHCKDN